MTRIERALRVAESDASTPAADGPRAPLSRPRRIAVGDPQAPFDTFLAILDRHGLLGDDGRLRDDVALASIGDHFDWGGPARRDEAARSGLLLLAWLAAHPPDQVALVAGNHDLARVGELVGFDDASFAAAQAEADLAYRGGAPDAAAERRLIERYPALATAETAARDLATFRADQRTLVADLLRAGRFLLGWAAADDLLLCHAGVTADDLDAIGLPRERQRDARAAADALNASLDAAVSDWNGREPLAIPGLYQPGSAAGGEARGILLQRPAHPECDTMQELYEGPLRRRFDPRWLPKGLTQAIGHIRDKKCRTLMRPWSDGAPPRDGPLRHLHVTGDDVHYARGLPPDADPGAATILFLDGGMNFVADPADYELLDLDARRVAEPA
ncbi:MAG TPA: metallophosphoesterase [Vicinamibacteria bacterium]|nr:metallophosphoesterase [Vicinamibacteria bacterium]